MLTQLIGLAPGKRHPCPYCESSDGFSVGDDGAKGWFHCFACGVHGDGIQYLRDVEGYTFREACDALGYTPPDDDLTRAAKRHEKRREPLRLYTPLSSAEKRRVERLFTETDKRLILEYAHRAITAESAAEKHKWSRKHRQVYHQRFEAELRDQREIGKLDSNYR